MYPDPDRFIPERFEGDAGKKVLDPTNYAFGFGRRSVPFLCIFRIETKITSPLRRICAGQNFADAVLYIGIVSILAALDISKHRDENGNEVDPEVSYSAAMIKYAQLQKKPLLEDFIDLRCCCSQVNPFKCTIKPRSDLAIALMQEE